MRIVVAAAFTVLLGCESGTLERYRQAKGNSPDGPSLETLKELIRDDKDFAQARIDLAEKFISINEKDSASRHLQYAIGILMRKRANELEEKDWQSSLTNACKLEAEIRCEWFSMLDLKDKDELEIKYNQLLAFVENSSKHLPSLAKLPVYQLISDKNAFINKFGFPFAVPFKWAVGKSEQELIADLGEMPKFTKPDSMPIAGRIISYDSFLRFGTCLIHNKAAGQEYTDCLMLLMRDGRCIAIRSTPGISMNLRYDRSVRSEHLLRDYLLIPLRDVKWKLNQTSDFSPFVKWTVSFESRIGYGLEITTLESSAYNPSIATREKNYVYDYMISGI